MILNLRAGGWLTDTLALQVEGNFLKGESFREHSDTDVKNFQVKLECPGIPPIDDRTAISVLEFRAESLMAHGLPPKLES